MASEEPAPRPKRQWFQKDQSDDQTLPPPYEERRSYEDFKRKTQQFLADDNQIRDTKEGIKEQIGGYGINRLKAIAGSALGHATIARSGWSETRANGSKTFQKFAAEFSYFLDAYSGIIDVIQIAGAPYSTVAYGTLSLLFAVVANKSGNEEKITSTLAEMKNSFPRLNLVTEIYPERKIEALVAEVYMAVIAFAKASTRYFTQSSGERLLAAVGKPPDLGVERIHRGLAEVNSECSVLLHKTASEIKGQNDVIRRQNDGLLQETQALRKMVEELKDQNRHLKLKIDYMHKHDLDDREDADQRRLDKFREHLGVPEACDHTNLQFCKGNLSKAFPAATGSRHQRRVAKYLQMTPKVLEEEEAYHNWYTRTHSCLLLLSGKSIMEGRTDKSTHSWLSPAAIHVAERLPADGGYVAYYCCHPEHRAVKLPTQEALLNLAYQILDWKPEILRRQQQHFMSLVQKEKWRDGEGEEALKAMSQMLVDLLAQLEPKTPVFIVLDRADQCKCKQYRLLKELLDVVRHASCVLKILVVMDSVAWNVDPSDCEYLQKSSEGYMEERLDWDQRKLPVVRGGLGE